MKICFISQNVSPGILIFRRDFIKYLLSKGYTVYAFALDYDEKSRKEVESLGAVPIDYSLSRTGLNPIKDFSDIIKLSFKIKRINPDIVFSFFVKPSVYGTLAAKIAGVPRRIAMLEGLGYIHTPSITGFSFKKTVLQYIHGLICTLAYAFAQKVIFLNPDDPNDLKKKMLIKADKIKVLGPIGLDIGSYFYSDVDLSKPVRFIFIARLLAEKGIFEYVEAANIVKKSYPTTEFVVLGGLDIENPSGISQERLDSLVKEGVIIYPGHVSNVQNWIAASHVFVLPSYYREGVPRSTQEAMAIGRAVITTDVPGCRETVKEGINGFKVPPFNAHTLAEKMIYFVENTHEIARMGVESHHMAVDKFDVDKINPVFEKTLTGE